MVKIRRSEERGDARHGWLNSRHTFSFADYYDPNHMGFRSLRVINEDRVAPGMGFGTHPHRDMEILSYILSGTLAHTDSMGHEEKLGPNEIQRMSAGTGIRHSEYNGSATEPVHFLQIWIEPATRGTAPSYEQIRLNPEDRKGKLQLLPVAINQDAKVFLSDLNAGETVTHALADKRHAWLHVIRGEATVNGASLQAGDAVAVSDEPELKLSTDSSVEAMLFDLA